MPPWGADCLGSEGKHEFLFGDFLLVGAVILLDLSWGKRPFLHFIRGEVRKGHGVCQSWSCQRA